MDYIKLFETQKRFEERIDCDQETRFKKKIMALIVEIGESANENPAIFKYWSKSHKSSSRKAAEYYAALYKKPVYEHEADLFLEELVDMFSFIISIGLEIDLNPEELHPTSIMLRHTADEADLYLLFSESVLNLYTIWSHYKMRLNNNHPIYGKEVDVRVPAYFELLGRFHALIAAFDYSLVDLEKAYYEKNSVNHERQNYGY